MKTIPLLLGFTFIAVTIYRIAHFGGGTILSWLMAIGLAIGVFVSSYFLDWASTRRAALSSLIFFMLLDGTFNLFETLRWSVATGRWAETLDIGIANIPIFRIADFLYGLFPTASAAFMGWLASKATAIGRRPRGTFWEQIQQVLLELVTGAAGSVEFSTRSKQPKKREPIWRKPIFEYLTNNPKATQTEIRDALNIPSKSTVSVYYHEFMEAHPQTADETTTD